MLENAHFNITLQEPRCIMNTDKLATIYMYDHVAWKQNIQLKFKVMPSVPIFISNFLNTWVVSIYIETCRNTIFYTWEPCKCLSRIDNDYIGWSINNILFMTVTSIRPNFTTWYHDNRRHLSCLLHFLYKC